MSQKQKSILSFFKQTDSKKATVGIDSTNSNEKKDSKVKDDDDLKISIVEKDLIKQDIHDSKNISPKGDSKAAKKTKGLSNGIGCKKPSIKTEIEKSTNKDCIDESPVKQTKKRKRAKILDSDDDSQNADELPKKKYEVDQTEDTNGNPSNGSSGSEDMETKESAMSEMDSRESKPNSDNAQQDEPMEDQSVESNPEISEKVQVKDTSLATTNGHSSSVQDKNVTEFIPKRKTARKQMRGGQQKKELPKIKPDGTFKTLESNDEKNTTATNDDLESKESNTENSDQNIKENGNNSDSSCKLEDNENKPKETIVKDVKKETTSPEKSRKVEKRKKLDTEPCQEDDDNKEKSPKAITEEETNSKKKPAIHPFFAKTKKEEVSSTEGDTEKMTTKASSSSGVIYDPSKSHYHPIDDACWKRNEKVPYLALAKTLELIENISKRLKIIEILANFFRSVIVLTPEDLLQSVYLCLNRLAPEYEGIELGIGDLLLMKALAQATGRTTSQIKAEVAVKGDLGLVAESSRGNQRLMFAPPKLTVSSVFSKFKEIAKMSGNTAMAKKTDKIQALFVACRECEAKYIIRSLSGKLRIGLAEQSVLSALARAAVLTPPNQSYPPEIIDKSSKMGADSFKEFLNAQILILKTTYCECPNYDLVIPVLLKEGIAGLPVHCQLTAGFPLKPMLAHPTNGIDEVLNRFDKNEFTCEFKYDGERAQIHMTDKGEIKIYSRNQEDNTSKYPDVISRISKAVKDTTKSFILDTEAVAWDCETKQILPFQVLSTRKKKDAVEADIVVQVCIMAFDLIYLNGESLVKKSLKERRDLLHSAFTEVENEFMFVTYRDGNSAETMQEFLDESLKGNCEGLMVKALTVDASYEIAKRSHNWLKLKKDYLSGIGDTLDLVVIGGYHGKGKRAGTYGGFLLACYDDENEEFQSICKLGTGFSDTDLENHSKFFKEHIIESPKSYYRYDTSLEPDVWFDAVQIWEIKCADLSISPIHKAAIGIVDPEKGISLRFPRFLRIRDDKSKPEDATVSSQIADMYEKQEQVQNAKKTTKTEEDYY